LREGKAKKKRREIEMKRMQMEVREYRPKRRFIRRLRSQEKVRNIEKAEKEIQRKRRGGSAKKFTGKKSNGHKKTRREERSSPSFNLGVG